MDSSRSLPRMSSETLGVRPAKNSAHKHALARGLDLDTATDVLWTSTTPPSGSCWPANAGGQRNSTSNGSATSSAPSCYEQRNRSPEAPPRSPRAARSHHRGAAYADDVVFTPSSPRVPW
jgi:hypothetical protein